MKAQITCPECGETAYVPTKRVARTFTCASCAHEFVPITEGVPCPACGDVTILPRVKSRSRIVCLSCSFVIYKPKRLQKRRYQVLIAFGAAILVLAAFMLITWQPHVSPAIVDNNEKIIVEGGVAKLAPDGDNFGESVDSTHWTVTSEHGGGTVTEASNKLTFNDPAHDDHSTRVDRSYLYGDADIVEKVVDLSPSAVGYSAAVQTLSLRDANNGVFIQYHARHSLSNQYLSAWQKINGVDTSLWLLPNPGAFSTLWMRIKRLRTSGPSNNYFYFYTSTDGIAWSLRWSGQIRDATYFHENHDVSPSCKAWHAPTTDVWEPALDRYYQKTDDGIPAQ